MKLKCIIAGSRDITEYYLIEQAFTECPWNVRIGEIISGTAKGVDRLGEELAEKKGLEIAKFPADWSRLGRGAGHIRNKDMAKYADMAIILWDGYSKGTKNMIENMQILGKPCMIFIFKNNELHLQ